MVVTAAVPDTCPYTQLQSRIQKRSARIAIIGMGYVGLPLALLFSQ